MLIVLAPAASTDLTTLDAAKVECGPAGAADGAAVAALVRQASAACARFCNRRTFARETYRQTEWAGYRAPLGPWSAGPWDAWPGEPGPGGGIMLAADLEPDVSAVAVDGTTLDPAEWTVADGMLYRRAAGGGAACGLGWSGEVVVDYAAGFELPEGLPGDIERACLLAVRAWFFARGRDPYLRSDTTEGVGTVAYATAPAVAGGALPAEAAALLAPWRRVGGF